MVSCLETDVVSCWYFCLLVGFDLYAGIVFAGVVIGDRWGDRLSTTYHRSVSAMNKAFQKGGDRLKEDFHFCIW